MRKSITKKLIMGSCALAATAVCLTSTTYAWFARNANAWTEEFEIKIHTDEGLEISIDGTHFVDTITKSELVKAISLQRYNLVNDENKKLTDFTSDEIDAMVNTYGETVLGAVSPNENWQFYGFNTIDNVKNPLDYIDGGYFKPYALTENKLSASYLKFDLYFRAIASSNHPKEKYNLVFADSAHDEGLGISYIQAEESEVTLNNELNILPSLDLRDDSDPANPIVKGLFKSGDKITINPANAMRIGVSGTEGDRIYELNEGYGSSAYKNATDDLHNPLVNPMVTYFNNTHKRAANGLYLKDYDTEYVETVKNFNDLYPLGIFQRDSEGEYNIVKATFYIWLDGYDADYLEGVDTESIRFFLNFTKVEG
ncbi:hypothetical protein EI71_01917 [Anaeroplasma bactoclasticum]|jgi:hypothetical protein|uniref:Uncharacterized protein n=1 Tax=Anaeroplasma bactoclasticum TaxID=2088 RepID=A0A397QXZ2_9MOLU|nr:hypothetical protein [Anaeroplasma bactoclasticum]RIA64765.1 hypothetical protein EI71_01917 [Anaeroplasma bactoclasticum]